MSRYHVHALRTAARKRREAGIVMRSFFDVPVRIPEIDVLMPNVRGAGRTVPLSSRAKPAEPQAKKPGLLARAFRAIFSRGAVRGG